MSASAVAKADRVPLPDRLRSIRPSVLILAVLAYLPTIFSSPGRMPADTKLYLYLDPGGLMGTAAQAWDTSQFGGWVPHQTMSYLWPSGPWFWAGEHLGLPDWVVHRLWLGTILFLGGWGVLRLARELGLAATGAFVAAVVYQLSPYTLPYVSRTSLMLLPWASLGWLTLLTIRSFRNGGWRYPALFALVLATVAGANATAFLMIVPGPIAWVVIEWSGKRLESRRVFAATGRIAVLSASVSLWWVTMLTVQGAHGADVLAYSETLDAVSLTSTSTEVMRGLGYWLFYIRDPYAAATTASIPYQTSLRLIAVGFILLLVCCAGLVVTRWAHRRFSIALLALGMVLSVGVHPFEQPAPLLSLIRDTSLGLALRSSTRALPLVALGLGLSAGALAIAVGARWPKGRLAAAAFVVLLAFVNIPSVWRADLVDPALTRDEQPPAAWLQAAAHLDAGVLTNRVLQLPGSEFGAFRWGYTVDPVLPGITDKPLITRDLLPLGSPGVMDLLYALDNRVQSGTLDIRSLAPVSRLLAADEIWVSNDLAFDRFRTPRPERFAQTFLNADDGLGETIAYGTPTVNQPDIPIVDEQSLADELVGTEIAPVLLRSVTDPVAMARVGARVVILDGSGDGIVDAAAAGLLHGDEAIFYANDLTEAQWQSLAGTAYFVITDSNRDRDQQWRGSQDALGMTESGGPLHDGITVDAGDQRLPLFADPDAAGDTQTTAQLAGGLVVQSSSYGEPYAFMPEARAAMAVDGDLATSWRTGDRWDLIGQSITVSQVPDGELQLVQAQGRQLRLMITAIDVTSGGVTQRVDLSDASLTAPGQLIVVPDDEPVTITIASVAERPDAPATGEYWVGFAELGPVAQEYVRPPATVLAQLPRGSSYAIVLHRDRVRATDRWRADPEPLMARQFTTVAPLVGTLSVSLRLNNRASDGVLNALAGWNVAPTSSDRLTGVTAAGALAAFDGDGTTRWISQFNTALGTELTVPLNSGDPVGSFEITQPDTVGLSVITEVRVTVAGESTLVQVPTPDASGVSLLELSAPVTGDVMTIEVTGIAPHFTTDRRYGQQVVLPVAISEISGLPVRRVPGAAPAPCTSDLLSIDGTPISLSVDVEALLAGETVDAVTCDGGPLQLAAGPHSLLGTNGLSTGIDVDDVRIVGGDAPAATGGTPQVTTVQHSDTHFSLAVEPCPDGCWLVFGQGNNTGWAASSDGRSLGTPLSVSGGFAGWWLPPTDTPVAVEIEFTPQSKVTRSLWISAAAVLCCAVLVARRGRADRRAVAGSPAAATPPQLVMPWRGDGAARPWVAAAALVACTGLFVAPAWTVPAAVVALLALVTRRLRLIAVAGVAGIAAIAALVLRRQWLYRYSANAAWPGNFEGLHRFGLFVILVLAIAFFASDTPDSPAREGLQGDPAEVTDGAVTQDHPADG